ncbi:MAG: thiamine pyrophosphate-dependent dehydrogenase E1 component subunit alpha [Hyphomicrobiaceae bacterium]|nr:thiamine pyrophosphate-dependent dehydrogenase E1 component subunit alpha [Hyphomicrobiaceae bacterium]
MAAADKASPLGLLRVMHLIREAELRLAQLFADGEIPGFIHLSVGQEGVAAGVGAALGPGDTLASNHRGHGHALAKGLDLDRFFLEIMGKAEGICGGRGGSMHVADAAVGMLGANGIVAAGLPIAVGSALAHQVRRTGAISSVFFGDGALAEGVMHESLNLAAIWKLPVLFVCESNGWSEFSPTAHQIAADPCALAASHGIAARSVDGNDAVAVCEAAQQYVSEIRGGGGPRFLECRTTRVRGHFEGDPQKYREGEGAARDDASDPIVRLERRLAADGVPGTEIAAAARAAAERVTAAVARARAGNLPDFAASLRDVYSPAAG